ncbi:MAG: EAL domain-containing protein [Burkholderiales bacterium]
MSRSPSSALPAKSETPAVLGPVGTTGRDAPMQAAEDNLSSLQHATVMMVDDDPVMLEAVQMFLEDVGYRSFVTTDRPAETLDLIAQHSPDVLLLDLNMPEVSGFDVLSQVRAQNTSRYLPVIVLSAEGDPSARLKALELGATDFLTKPVDPSELQLRLRNTLAFKAYQDRLADYDALSGLRNRRRFEADLRQILATSPAPTNRCAVLHVDLDRFKQVNDTLGHRIGDRLLRAAARRIEQIAHEVEAGLIARVDEVDARVTTAHVSGDGFAMLLSGLRDADNSDRVARAVVKGFTLPFKIDEHEIYVSASVGVSLHPVDAANAEELLTHAEMAMYHAKGRGRSTFEYFSPEFNARATERLTLEGQLRRALERGEFLLHYQPKVSVLTGRILGAEALIRWHHPEQGIMGPGRFIPVAEEAGLIVDLGRWVVEQACRQLATWQAAGIPPLNLSVNVSAAQFQRNSILIALRDALKSSGANPKQLWLEVTESMLMSDVEAGIALLKAIRGLGVRLSIDDFGTGYSSLSYLRRLPLDELKIDRSFLQGVPAEKDSTAIVRAVIAMAHEMNLKVVAEGVESTAQLEYLRAHKCDEYQGYLCSRPVPPEQFALMLSTRAAR